MRSLSCSCLLWARSDLMVSGCRVVRAYTGLIMFGGRLAKTAAELLTRVTLAPFRGERSAGLLVSTTSVEWL